MDPNPFLWALALGALASVSLPLGSIAGLVLRPPPALAALLAAFGAGAIVAALAVELVAPTVEAVARGEHGAGPGRFFGLVAGAAAGGVLFVLLDALLAARGGFLRKASTSISWFTGRLRAEQAGWVKEVCASPILRQLPVEQVSLLTRDARPLSFAAEEALFREGDPPQALYVIRRGEVALRRGGSPVETVGAGGILGELPILAGLPHALTAVARGPVEVLAIGCRDLARWRETCPEFDAGLRELATRRLEEIRERDARQGEEERRWGERAIEALRTGAMVPTPLEMRRAAEQHEGSPLAVWLGLLLDGVPESLVIGAGFATLLAAQAAAGEAVTFASVIPYTLVAGVFLSNFPEALSSSLGMRAQGWSVGRVLSMWLLLLAVTAVATALGSRLGTSVSHDLLVAIEGLAAGAALTAVTATMIPEAVHLAGSGGRVGLATLAGFFAAVSFKLLE